MQPVLIPPEAGRRQGMGWTTGGLEVESNFKPDRPLPHAPSPEKKTPDLCRFQEHSLAKVGWTLQIICYVVTARPCPEPFSNFFPFCALLKKLNLFCGQQAPIVGISSLVYNVTNYYSVTDNIFHLIVDFLAYVASK